MIERLIKAIKRGNFDFETVMAKKSYFGAPCNITPLFCSYGQIGWCIYIDGKNLVYDYEMNNFSIK